MFKFNFSSEDGQETAPSKSPVDDLIWLPAELLVLQGDYKSDEDSLHTYRCGQFSIKYHDISATIEKALNATNSIAIAEENQSDLLPAKYEGGLKIWECTYDLTNYLCDEFSSSTLSQYNILDLGCGAGLLGILALKLGGSVTFQDYNKEVLETITIPNVLANISEDEKKNLLSTSQQTDKKICQFYCGDWGSFAECYQSNEDKADKKFDFILTSETIYNPVNHKKLSSLFRKCLKKGGTVYLAAKTHYFGVGGGTRQFEDVVHDDEMISTVCWKSEGGVQREILKITFKD